MVTAVLSYLAALATISAAASILSNHIQQDDYVQNDLSPIPNTKEVNSRDWLEVSQKTGRFVEVSAGQRVELECEVLGRPPPTAVQWFKGAQPITQDYDAPNFISGVGLGKLISRFVIECAQPTDQGTYTCASISGGQTRISSPSALIVKGSANCIKPSTNVERAPRITTWSPVVLENINNDVILPCNVKGNPTPKVFWVNEDKHVLGNSFDNRIKVTDNGDLVIRRIRWDDMGGYTCIAESRLGRDSRLSFLYPLLNER